MTGGRISFLSVWLDYRYRFSLQKTYANQILRNLTWMLITCGQIISIVLLKVYRPLHCKLFLRDSWICFAQTFQGLGLGKLFPARESLVSNILAGDGNTAYLFLQCNVNLMRLIVNIPMCTIITCIWRRANNETVMCLRFISCEFPGEWTIQVWKLK